MVCANIDPNPSVLGGAARKPTRKWITTLPAAKHPIPAPNPPATAFANALPYSSSAVSTASCHSFPCSHIPDVDVHLEEVKRLDSQNEARERGERVARQEEDKLQEEEEGSPVQDT